MKIKVTYKKEFGRERFYPANDETRKLLSLFLPPSITGKSFSRRQIEGLKELGFKIEAKQDEVEI